MSDLPSKQSHKSTDVVIFSAHPDDSEMAMGGTMLKLAASGYSILNVALTRSQLSTYGDTETRAKEFAAAAEAIGCASLICDLVDQELENTIETRLLVARILREHRPRLVFAPYHTNPIADFGGISNRDHWTAGGIVRDGVKLARLEKAIPELPRHQIDKLFFYMLPRNISPTVLVDVSEVIERVFEVISCYRSQMSIEFQGTKVKDLLRASRSEAGLTAGMEFAEGFISDMPFEFSSQTFFDV